MATSYVLKSLACLSNAHVLSFSASSYFAPSTLKAWLPVSSQGGRSPGVPSGCVDPGMDLQTSIAFILQLVFIVRGPTSAVAIYLRGVVSGIRRDISMATMLNCVALVAAVGRSASAMIASTGVVLICPVIALTAYLWHISSIPIVEIEDYRSHTGAVFSTVDLPVVM